MFVVKAKPLIFALLGLLAGVILSTTFFRVQTTNNAQASPISTPAVAAESDNQDLTPAPSSQTESVLVTKVIDGDTIEIEGGTRVRLIGIDTPETVDPRTTVQCFGREASTKLRELLEGKQVKLEKDISETDRYQRLLRYVYLGEIFINEIMVRDGFAISSSYPPDVKYQEVFNQAQTQARNANRGLWGACATSSPVATTPTLGTTTTNQTQESVDNTSTNNSGECDIKGNISSSGEKIYHMPEQNFYNRTAIDESKGERWFCSETEATAAGWRKSKT